MQPSGLKFPKPTRVAKARKPLRRSYMKKRRPRRLSRPGSDPAYLEWVRSLACCVYWIGGLNWNGCDQRVHAHHAGRRPGVSMKADDKTAIPLCDRHHRQWHDANGVFAGLSKLERFAWSVRAIAATQAARERG